jgi:hypothetical protein
MRAIEIGETLLAALESILATSVNQRIFPYREALTLAVEPEKDSSESVSSIVAEVDGEPRVEIRYDSKRSPTTQKERARVRTWLLELIGQVIPLIAVLADPEAYIDRIMGEERGLSRALDYSEVSITLRNVLGLEPWLKLSDWTNGFNAKAFPLRRSERWCGHETPENVPPSKPVEIGSGDPPPQLLNAENLKHREIQIRSLINVGLWDRAIWKATGFAWPQDTSEVPPLLALCFEDEIAAKAIFQAWRKKLGDFDEHDDLRVSILTGVDKDNPFFYRVVVGANLKVGDRASHMISMVARINQMEPRDAKNLEAFLRQFNLLKRYVLAPGRYVDEKTGPVFFPELGIEKMTLNCRPIWQISENDPDACALHADDQPTIPENIKDAPVLRALRRLRTVEKERP